MTVLTYLKMYAENQAETFQSDPIISQLTQPTAIRYSGCLYGQEDERRRYFLQACQSRKLSIVSVLIKKIIKHFGTQDT